MNPPAPAVRSSAANRPRSPERRDASANPNTDTENTDVQPLSLPPPRHLSRSPRRPRRRCHFAHSGCRVHGGPQPPAGTARRDRSCGRGKVSEPRHLRRHSDGSRLTLARCFIRPVPTSSLASLCSPVARSRALRRLASEAQRTQLPSASKARSVSTPGRTSLSTPEGDGHLLVVPLHHVEGELEELALAEVAAQFGDDVGREIAG